MKTNLIGIFIFIRVFAFGQIDQKFINHLVYNNLNLEHKSYLSLLEKQNDLSDSLIYFKTKFALFTNDSSNYNKLYPKCSLCFNDTNLLKYSASYFTKLSLHNTKKLWDVEFKTNSNYSKNTLLYKSFELIQNPSLNPDFLPYTLQMHYNEFKAANRKNIWLAGALSAIVPGSGKLYIGRPHSFWGSFITNTLYGITAYESINKLGIKNGYSIFTTGVFGVFYLSNIFGTAFDLKRLKIEKKKHFLYEVADYQSAGIYLY